MPPQEAHEETLIFIDRVVNTSIEVRTLIRRRRIPQKACRIQTIANPVIVRLRIGSEELTNRRVQPNAFRIIGRQIEARYAIRVGSAGASAYTRQERPGIAINQQGVFRVIVCPLRTKGVFGSATKYR
jgi:hypothetical protein